MKILFICQRPIHNKKFPFGQGGTESQIHGLALALTKKGHEVEIAGHFEGNEWIDPSVNISLMRFINIKSTVLPDEKIGNFFSCLILSKKISSEIKINRPDVLIVPAPFIGFFLSKVNLPILYVTHNPNGMDFYKKFILKNHWLNFFSFILHQKFEMSTMRKSNAVIALNADIKKRLIDKGISNIYQVPNGVNVHDYYSGIEHNYILFAGGFRKVKGVELLIVAFSKIVYSHNTDLILIGSGKEEKQLKKLVLSLKLDKRVHFIPLVDKVILRRYLSECSVFVLPSLFETFGITLLEAMASSRAVIASDIPGPHDVIIHRYNGFLFEKENADQLAEYLNLCLSDEILRKTIGNNARKTIEKNFTFDGIAEQYLDIMQTLVKNGKFNCYLGN